MPMISIATFSGEEVKDTGVNFKFPKEKPYMPKKEKLNLVSLRVGGSFALSDQRCFAA